MPRQPICKSAAPLPVQPNDTQYANCLDHRESQLAHGGIDQPTVLLVIPNGSQITVTGTRPTVSIRFVTTAPAGTPRRPTSPSPRQDRAHHPHRVAETSSGQFPAAPGKCSRATTDPAIKTKAHLAIPLFARHPPRTGRNCRHPGLLPGLRQRALVRARVRRYHHRHGQRLRLRHVPPDGRPRAGNQATRSSRAISSARSRPRAVKASRQVPHIHLTLWQTNDGGNWDRHAAPFTGQFAISGNSFPADGSAYQWADSNSPRSPLHRYPHARITFPRR